MSRAHVYRPITDEAGNLLYGATVSVQGDGGAPLTQAVYSDATSGASLPNPYIATAGVVDIWLNTPQRLFLTVTPVSGPSIGVSVDANPPADEAFYGIDGRIVVSNSGTAGQSLQLVTPPAPGAPGEAQWADALAGTGLSPSASVTDWTFADGVVPGAITFSGVKNDLTTGASTPIGSAAVVVDPVSGTALTHALRMPTPTDTAIVTGFFEFTVTAQWSVSMTEDGVFQFWHKVVRDPSLVADGFTEIFVQMNTPSGWYTEPVGNPDEISRTFALYSVHTLAGTSAIRIRTRHYFNGDTDPAVLTKVSTLIAGINVTQGAQVPPHSHGDPVSLTTLLGPSAVVGGIGSTAVGASASATANDSVALGHAAVASGVSALGLGSASSATGIESIALGYLSVAPSDHATAIGSRAQANATESLAVGYLALANGISSIAVGNAAQASGVYATALGAGAIASADRSVALGYTAAATHADAMAIGPGAATTATSQIVLGAATHVVYVPGNFRLLGDGVIGSAGSMVGFYGSIGTTQPTVTGSRSGNAALASLLTSLAGLGLIVNSSSA